MFGITLERREKELIAKLNDVRAAAYTQRHKVEELIRQLPVTPINRLRNETLLQIFELILRSPHKPSKDHHVYWERKLATVSRR